MRSAVVLPDGMERTLSGSPALSPDGTMVVFSAIRDGRAQLFRRRLADAQITPIDGTERGDTPFFSPDGQWLGFTAGDGIKKVRIEGGQPQLVAHAAVDGRRELGRRRRHHCGPTAESGLWRVPASGGTPERLTTVTPEDGDNDHRWPQVLPRGRGVLFSVSTGPEETARIVVLDARTGTRKDLLTGSASARFVATGHLVYARNAELQAVPFDLERLEITGPAVRVAEGVNEDTDGMPEYAFSDRGDLVYFAGVVGRRPQRAHAGGPGRLRAGDRVSASPHRRSAVLARRPANRDDRRCGEEQRLGVRHRPRQRHTGDGGPLPCPDVDQRRPAGGEQRTAGAPRPGAAPRRRRGAGGDADSLGPAAVRWRLDRRRAPRDRAGGRRHDWDIVALDLATRQVTAVVATPASEVRPRVSPDGRWLAYLSDESGRLEAFVRGLAPGAGRQRVSTNGALGIGWAPDGRTLYFTGLTDRAMWASRVTTTPALAVGPPTRMFGIEPYIGRFDISPDGKRFAMMQRGPLPPRNRLELVQNALGAVPGAR